MNMIKLIMILINIESNDGRFLVGDHGMARGVLQIRPVMVREVNRIIGQDRFTLADRDDLGKSISMCSLFLCHQRGQWRKKFGEEPSWVRLGMSWNTGGIFNGTNADYREKLNNRIFAKR